LLVLLFLFFAMRIFLSFLEPLAHYIPWLHIGRISALLMGYILPVVLIFVVTSVLYAVLPQKQVGARQALLGALATTLLLEVGKHIFTYYAMLKVSQFGVVYGSLTAVVIFLLWVFYASCIFLFGAEIVRNLESATRPAEASEPG